MSFQVVEIRRQKSHIVFFLLKSVLLFLRSCFGVSGGSTKSCPGGDFQAVMTVVDRCDTCLLR